MFGSVAQDASKELEPKSSPVARTVARLYSADLKAGEGWVGNPKFEIRNGWVGGIPNSEFRIPNS